MSKLDRGNWSVAQWFDFWYANVAAEDLNEFERNQFQLILESVLAGSRLREITLANLRARDIYRFYGKELRGRLPSGWARRIYQFARFASLAARSVNLAPKYPRRINLWTFWFRVQRIARQASLAFMALIVLFGGATAVRAVEAREDVLNAAASVARNSGFGVVVAVAEDIYYGYIKVALVGGKPSEDANFSDVKDSTPEPTAKPAEIANVSAWGPAQIPSSIPERLKSPVTPVKDEGVWSPTLIKVNGSVAIRVARVRPDSEHTSYFATVTWLDTKLLAFMQVPGTDDPPGNFDRGDGMVPDQLSDYYVAGLNNAFLLRDSRGGYYYKGKSIKPLVRGKATLVTYKDGSIDIIQWGRDRLRGSLQAARQNLQLNVDNGISQVKDESQSKWGWAWQGIGSGKNLVWRSGMGIRADGTLVYVIGDAISAKSLADLLVRAGAVRAMPLDMNSGYANGFLYGPYEGGKRLDPNIYREPDRFLIPSERDFVAVFAKSPE